MGVPSFFRWLVAKYPKVVVPAIEEVGLDLDGIDMEVDLTGDNPNGIEFDNLYLDMNGLVHPCCHPESGPQPKDEEEMMLKVFEYIDELFAVVRPRKLIYMAMDGVAPRAKMNQQRARRFKAAKDSELSRKAEETVRKEIQERGVEPPPPRPPSWDHNVITPGTKFMEKLSSALQWYIYKRINENPAWQGLKVILSDSNQPGEGEHKIAHFIRQMRLQPGYDPNTRHCLHGLDADLVMLALAAHEPYFTISRDHIDFKNPGQKGRNKEEEPPGTSDFDFLHVNILREYLQAEFGVLNNGSLPFPYDFENCIDDWVFLCFFVGNDFLPHLPSLDIKEGALDDLLEHYVANLGKVGGYLSSDGDVDMSKVAYILYLVGQKEEHQLRERIIKDAARKAKFAHKDKQRKDGREEKIKEVYKQLDYVGKTSAKTEKDAPVRTAEEFVADILSYKKELLNDVEGQQPDSIRYDEPGWKERYYIHKFGAKDAGSIVSKAADAAEKYFEGLLWVFRYYTQGCPSWKWFYPYHYSPFPSDLAACVDPDNKYDMELGKPFLPYEQLMSVFPAASNKALPKCYHYWMEDAKSPIVDFYPKEFPIDTEGRKFAWQGVVILPWIDEQRLLQTIKPLEQYLNAEETKRNAVYPELVYVHSSHPLAAGMNNNLYKDNNADEGSEPPSKKAKIASLYPFKNGKEWAIDEKTGTDGQIAGTIIGTNLNVPVGGTMKVRDYPELEGCGKIVNPITDNQVVMGIYQLPPHQRHKCELLPGLTEPPSTLTDVDKIPTTRPAGVGHGFIPPTSANVEAKPNAAINIAEFDRAVQAVEARFARKPVDDHTQKMQDHKLQQRIRQERHAAGIQ